LGKIFLRTFIAARSSSSSGRLEKQRKQKALIDAEFGAAGDVANSQAPTCAPSAKLALQ